MDPGQPADGVANVGLIRPPFVYLIAIGLGLLLHWFWPIVMLPASINVPIGVALILVAVALFVSSVRTFRNAGTPVPGNLPTTAVVRAGPYRFSRNPIYLAFTLFHFGTAIWVNSGWLLVTLAAAVTLMYVVIRREEQYLERKFAADYLDYKAAVRRWL